MKRVWREARLVLHEAGGYRLLLDGRPLRLADGSGIRIETRALAQAILEEWRQAGAGRLGSGVHPDEIGLTRLAATLEHRIAPHREKMVEELLPWGQDDLLRYRASDPAIVAEQAKVWDPALDWLDATYGLRVDIGTGISPLKPVEGEAACWRSILSSCSDAALTALGTLVPALGSLILALATISGHLTPEEAVRMARLDEDQQARRWGQDPSAASAYASTLHEASQALTFLRLSEVSDER